MRQAPRPRARPTGIAGALVTLTVRMLPAEHRDRYDAEFRADLCVLTPGRQIVQAGGLLVRGRALRGALEEEEMAGEMKSARYWLCRLGRHKYRLVSDDNEENRRSFHSECTRCLKFKELKEYEATDGKYLGGMIM